MTLHVYTWVGVHGCYLYDLDDLSGNTKESSSKFRLLDGIELLFVAHMCDSRNLLELQRDCNASRYFLFCNGEYPDAPSN